MKSQTRSLLTVTLEGMDQYWTDLESIQVLFAQNRNGIVSKRSSWNVNPGVQSDISIDAEKNEIYIPWTRSETGLFKENSPFWMDIRPTLQNGFDIEIDPVELRMSWSLFEE